MTQLEADLARIGSCAAAVRRPVQCEVATRGGYRPVQATIGALHGACMAGAVRQVRRLDRRHIALLSPAEMKRPHALLNQLDQQLTHAQQQIDVLTEIRNITAAGLLDGTLAITGSDSPGGMPATTAKPEDGKS